MSARRSWRLLLGIWGTYWLALSAFALGPLALAVYRATNAPLGQGNVSVSYGTAGLNVTVIRQGHTLYSAAISVVALALWIAGPPLLAWLAVATINRRAERRETASV